MFNLPTSAIKALDSLLEHIQEETVEPIEDSIKGLKRNFKAGNYLAVSALFILTGSSMVSSQAFEGQFFIVFKDNQTEVISCHVDWHLSFCHCSGVSKSSFASGQEKNSKEMAC